MSTAQASSPRGSSTLLKRAPEPRPDKASPEKGSPAEGKAVCSVGLRDKTLRVQGAGVSCGAAQRSFPSSARAPCCLVFSCPCPCPCPHLWGAVESHGVKLQGSPWQQKQTAHTLRATLRAGRLWTELALEAQALSSIPNIPCARVRPYFLSLLSTYQ